MDNIDFKGLVMEYLSIQDESKLNAKIERLQEWKDKMEAVRKSVSISTQMLKEDLK